MTHVGNLDKCCRPYHSPWFGVVNPSLVYRQICKWSSATDLPLISRTAHIGIDTVDRRLDSVLRPDIADPDSDDSGKRDEHDRVTADGPCFRIARFVVFPPGPSRHEDEKHHRQDDAEGIDPRLRLDRRGERGRMEPVAAIRAKVVRRQNGLMTIRTDQGFD